MNARTRRKRRRARERALKKNFVLSTLFRPSEFCWDISISPPWEDKPEERSSVIDEAFPPRNYRTQSTVSDYMIGSTPEALDMADKIRDKFFAAYPYTHDWLLCIASQGEKDS